MSEPTTDAELEAQEFTEFIDAVWKALYPNGELGEWDYPAQVIRHLTGRLALDATTIARLKAERDEAEKAVRAYSRQHYPGFGFD